MFISHIVLDLKEGYIPTARAYFESGDIRSFDPCNISQRDEVAKFVHSETRIFDMRYPGRTFLSFVKDRDSVQKKIAKRAKENRSEYDPIVFGLVNAIRIFPSAKQHMAELAFAFGSTVVVPWTEEGIRSYLKGINGYTIFFDERT